MPTEETSLIDTTNLESQIESVLFWKGEPVSVKNLAKILETEKEIVEKGINSLQISLKNRGICIVQNGDEVMLYTAPESSELIKKVTKDELSKEVSKAGVEVLSLLIYRGPISKREIDYIRGVNSGFIIRNLMIRGLIERVDGADSRSFVYQPTFELLAHLGISKKEELPDFDIVQKDIEAFTKSTETGVEMDGEIEPDQNNG